MVRSQLTAALLSAACIVLSIALVLSMASNSAIRDERDRAEMEALACSVLGTAQATLADELWSISSSVMDAALELSAVTLDSEASSAVLADLVASNDHIVNAVTMNASGFIINAFPDAYRNIISEYVGDHEATVEMMVHGKPVFSDVFSTVEGFEATVIAYPVFDGEGWIIGSVTAVIRTEQMITALFQELSAGDALGIMVEQIDGRILYDEDASQIGKYTYDDPLYQQSPSLLELARQVSAHYSGQGDYTFNTEEEAFHKKAAWTSVTLHERSWRVLVYWEV